MSSVNNTVTRIKSGEAIVECLMRYSVGTTSTFMAGPLAGLSDKAAERAISRLLADGSIESHPLKGPMRYYTLSAETARKRGIHDGRGSGTQAMGFQGLCQNYAMTASCLFSSPQKQRLTRDEFASRFPMICENARSIKHFRTRYFLDVSDRANGVVRLGLFVADLGQNLRRLVRKVRREVERRRTTSFGPLIAERLFAPCVLTAFPKKAEQIQAALKDETFPVRVEVVAGLSDIL